MKVVSYKELLISACKTFHWTFVPRCDGGGDGCYSDGCDWMERMEVVMVMVMAVMRILMMMTLVIVVVLMMLVNMRAVLPLS